MSHFVKVFFEGWTKENIWIFGVDLLILILIFAEDILKFGAWCIDQRKRANTFEVTLPKTTPALAGEFDVYIEVHDPVEIRNFNFSFVPVGSIFVSEIVHLDSPHHPTLTPDGKGGVVGTWESPLFRDKGTRVRFQLKLKIAGPWSGKLIFTSYDGQHHRRAAKPVRFDS